MSKSRKASRPATSLSTEAGFGPRHYPAFVDPRFAGTLRKPPELDTSKIPYFDVLPKIAKKRIEALNLRIFEARSTVEFLTHEEARKNDRVASIEKSIKELQNEANEPHNRYYVESTQSELADEIKALKTELKEKQSDLEEAKLNLSIAYERWTSNGRLLDRTVPGILKELPVGYYTGQPLFELSDLGDMPETKSTDNLIKVRDKITSLKLQRRQIIKSAQPAETLKALAREQIEKLAEAGRPTINLYANRSAVFTRPKSDLERLGPRGFGEGLEAITLMAWVNKQAIIDAVDLEIDECLKDHDQLSETEKTEKLAALDASLFELERKEVALVFNSDASESFRDDTDAFAFLNVKVVTQTEEKLGAEKFWKHSKKNPGKLAIT